MKYEQLTLDVWKTIKLGTGLKTAEVFCHALRDGGFRLSDGASEILGRPAFKVADEETKKDLVRITGGELGFKSGKKGIRCDYIYKRAKEFGLELCPPEVGPQLRLQYRDQPNGECILVAMEPIINRGLYPMLFILTRNNSGLWLYSYCGSRFSLWSANEQWVFCRPRK